MFKRNDSIDQSFTVIMVLLVFGSFKCKYWKIEYQLTDINYFDHHCNETWE